MTKANALAEADHLAQAIKDKLRWLNGGGDKAISLDEAFVTAKSNLAQVQEHLETIEASITDNVLGRDDLSNEAKRKAAITKAMRTDESWLAANQELLTAKAALLRIETEREGLKRTLTSDYAALTALGKAAELVSHSLLCFAQDTALEAAHARLRGVTNHVR